MATTYTGNDLATRLRLGITRMSRRLRQEAGNDLSPSLSSALATISRHGPLTPSEIAVRERVQTDPHSPDHFRANGAIVNQPGFGPAFGCKTGQPMDPAKNCRVW